MADNNAAENKEPSTQEVVCPHGALKKHSYEYGPDAPDLAYQMIAAALR